MKLCKHIEKLYSFHFPDTENENRESSLIIGSFLRFFFPQCFQNAILDSNVTLLFQLPTILKCKYLQDGGHTLLLIILQLPSLKLITSSVRTTQFTTTNLPQLFKWI